MIHHVRNGDHSYDTGFWATIKREGPDLAREVVAIVTALTVVGGAFIGAWQYFGFWVPLSTSQHQHDLTNIRSDQTAQFNSIRRSIIQNRLETLQGRVTSLIHDIHEVTDAVLVHRRALGNPAVSIDDKDISRRRLSTLAELGEVYRMRLRAVYEEMNRLRVIQTGIPYDPRFGDVTDVAWPVDYSPPPVPDIPELKNPQDKPPPEMKIPGPP